MTGSFGDFNLTDLVSIKDLTKEQIVFVLKRSSEMEAMPKKNKKSLLEGKTVASLFFEPSTRTRLSFETAIQNLGGKVIGFAEAGVSSAKKGESLSDSIKTVSNYADLLVLRHYLEGAAKRAAEVSSKPVINAGDGSNQHPTQTLLDLYTIQKQFGKLNDLKIGFVGDLKYGRTVHSLVQALVFFKPDLCFISPDILGIPDYIKEELGEKHINFVETSQLTQHLPELDLLYVTRIQKERFPDPLDYERVKNAFVLGKELIAKAKPSIRIMHPLPRVNEIKPELDSFPGSIYFKQAANGIPVREALLSLLINAKKGSD